MKLFYSSKQKGFIPPNPESPDRVESIKSFLEGKTGFDFVEAKTCSREDLLRVHSEEYVSSIERGSRLAGEGQSVWLSPDTPIFSDAFDLASIAAGGAMQAALSCKQGEPTFALVRPPGHHAGKDFGHGFCYFNNLAVAVESVINKYKRILILDVDAHYGDGTADIFKARNDVLYFSLHQWPCFPGTGWMDEVGEGAGAGYTVNVPLPPGTGGKEYLGVLNQFLPIFKEQFKPDLVAVSLGFDTYAQDPITNLSLNTEDFYSIGRLVSDFFDTTFVCLEGGYALSALPELAFNFFVGLKSERANVKKYEKQSSKHAIAELNVRLQSLRQNMSKYWDL